VFSGAKRLLASSDADAWLVVIGALSVILAYSPGLFLRFAFADDYAYLAIHGFRAANPLFLADGRPIGGMLAVLLFTTFDTISSDAVLRLLGLGQLLIAAALIIRSSFLAGLQPPWAVFLGLSFAATPAVQNWVPWGVAAWQFPALIFALASIGLWRTLIDARGQISYRSVIGFSLLSLVGLLIYQPFATAAWPLIVLERMLQHKSPYISRRFFTALLAYGLVLLCYFLLFKFLLIRLVPEYGPHGRTSILPLQDVWDRAVWFLTVPVFAAFTPLHFKGTIWTLLPALTIVACGLWLMSRRSVSHFLWHLILVGGLLVITHIPSLAAPERTGIRTQVSLSLAALTVLIGSLDAICQELKVPERMQRASALILGLISVVYAGYLVLTINVWPQALELTLIERKLNQTHLPSERPILLVGLPPGASLAGRYCDEITNLGCASASMQFALPNIVRLWMRQRGIDFNQYKLLFRQSSSSPVAVSFEPDRTTYGPIPTTAFVLDLGSVVEPSQASRVR
jgi:hypothetical protein